MSNVCGEPHHDDPSLRCSLPPGNHQYHTAVRPGVPPMGVDWRNEDFVEAARPRTAAQRQAVKRNLTDRVREANGQPTSRSSEEQTRIRAAFIAQAIAAVRHYAQQHPGTFTFPADIWPLLEHPGIDTRNAMSTVSREIVRRRYVARVGYDDVKGAVFHTKDGIEFQENRPVARFESRLCFEDPAANS